MNKKERFDSALYGVSERIRNELQKLPLRFKENAEEIRLRAGMPVALTVGGETIFIRKGGEADFIITKDLLRAEKEDVEQSFRLLCKNSVYAHTEELKNGFIKMENGHRAGVCGNLTQDGHMTDITSVNIRIAREIFGAANDIARAYKSGGWLLAGPPGSGKTTVLRDLVRQLSCGLCGKVYRVAVIDSRGEISGGNMANDLGPASDVLITADKAAGIEMAVRTMYPDIIVFDEIGTSEELKRVSAGFCAGVDIITTAHIGDLGDLMRRDVTARLLKSGAIANIAILPEIHGGDIKIKAVKELFCGLVV